MLTSCLKDEERHNCATSADCFAAAECFRWVVAFQMFVVGQDVATARSCGVTLTPTAESEKHCYGAKELVFQMLFGDRSVLLASLCGKVNNRALLPCNPFASFSDRKNQEYASHNSVFMTVDFTNVSVTWQM